MATVEFCDALLGELYDTGDIGMDGPVAADMRVEPRSVPVSLLTNEDFACFDHLTAEALYATPLRSTISAVGG